MSTPNYTVAMVAYPVLPGEPAPVGYCLVEIDGVYQVSTVAARGTRKTSGVVTSAGAVNQGVFMQSFGDIPARISGLSAGTAGYIRVGDTGRIERADPLTSSDDICGFCEADGSCHLFFGGLVSPSIAIIAGVGTMNTTNPTTAAATGIVLPTTGRVFTVEINNTKNVVSYVFLYDGSTEIGRVAVPAASTWTEPFVNGQDLAVNLNYSASSTQGSFTADPTATIVASARYAPAGAASTAPILSQVNPNTGATAGNTAVVLTGVNFTGATQVLFDGIAATGLTVNSNTQVSCLTPAHSTQSVTVSIVTPNGTATLPNGFTYSDVVVAPAVTSVSPTFGPIAGGTTITIIGTGFVTGATVAIDGNACTGVTVNSSTSITAVTPAHTTQNNLTLLVTNPSGLSGSLPNAFSYTGAAAPTIVSILPTSGSTSGGTAFTLVTTNAVSGATVKFDTFSATSVNVASAISVTGVTPAHGAGTSAVTITNPDTQTYTLPAAYTYSAPPPVINPADYALTAWYDMDDFNIGMQACVGRASAGSSGLKTMVKDIGSAVAFGPNQNGKKSILLASNGLQVASQQSDIFGASGYTFFALMDLTSIDAASDDAAAFYQRSPVLAVQSGAGCYCGISVDGNIELVDYNGGFTTPGAIASHAIPTSGYVLVIGRYDGSNLKLQFGSGAVSTVAFAGPLTPGAGVPVRIGYTGSGIAPILGAKLLNFMASDSFFNTSDTNDFIAYFNSVYSLSL